ncbi:hypothetical protein BH18VER1_BH18VER1_04780 [soil metagenome]
MFATTIEAEVAKIRENVRANGGFTVDPQQLRLLCPDELSVAQQFACIAAIAQHEDWSFAFLPSGEVHFGSYTTASSAR